MEPDALADTSLPDPDLTRMALGHLARVLEDRLPGVLDEWVESLEDAHAGLQIVRLRKASQQAEMRRVRAEALNWVRHVRLIWFANIGAKRSRKRRG